MAEYVETVSRLLCLESSYYARSFRLIDDQRKKSCTLQAHQHGSVRLILGQCV